VSQYPSQETVNDADRPRRWAGSLRRRWTLPKVSRAIGWLVLIMLLPVLVLLIGIYGVWYATRMAETREANLELAQAVAAAFEASVQDVLRSYKLYANCYIAKPVDFTQFMEVVQSIEHFWLTIVTLPREK
jgi:hypothetical protein